MLLLWAGTSVPVAAQLINGPASVDLGVNYTADVSNASPGVCGCFAMQGGGVNARLGLTDRLSAVADFSVVNTSRVPSTNFGLGLITLMAGPQLRYRVGRYTSYGQVLLGAVRGFDSVFPASSSNSPTSFVFEAGAGSEIRIHPKFSTRLIEVDYMHTGLPNNSNNWQNHLKIAAGLIYHF
jgi:hypothetical protein